MTQNLYKNIFKSQIFKSFIWKGNHVLSQPYILYHKEKNVISAFLKSSLELNWTFFWLLLLAFPWGQEAIAGMFCSPTAQWCNLCNSSLMSLAPEESPGIGKEQWALQIQQTCQSCQAWALGILAALRTGRQRCSRMRSQQSLQFPETIQEVICYWLGLGLWTNLVPDLRPLP